MPNDPKPTTDLDVILADPELKKLHREVLMANMQFNLKKADLALREISTPIEDPKKQILTREKF